MINECGFRQKGLTVIVTVSPLFSWSERLDLNQRPFAPKANALPSCATLRKKTRHAAWSKADGAKGGT